MKRPGTLKLTAREKNALPKFVVKLITQKGNDRHLHVIFQPFQFQVRKCEFEGGQILRLISMKSSSKVRMD